MKPISCRLPTAVCLLLSAVCLLMAASTAFARAGGGHSFSGGGGHGGGGDGGDVFELFYFLIMLTVNYPAVGIPMDFIILGVLAAIIYSKVNNTMPPLGDAYSSQRWEHGIMPAPPPVSDEIFDTLRHYDPNFSQILFTDFTYALFAQVQEARGRHDLPTYSPYLNPFVIKQLQDLSGPDLHAVSGVIVGESRILNVSNPIRPMIFITVEFETNYTEAYGTKGERSASWYTKEQWTFSRKRDILSRPPEKITAIHCPNCGGALARNPDGTCQHCGVKVVGGDFDWCVSKIRILRRENRGPLLTEDVPEVGTDLPTVFQPHFPAVRQRFLAHNPDFSWPQLEGRVRNIFLAVQAAWTTRDWDCARPYVSDSFFLMEVYWITEYKRQKLRNVLADIAIEKVVPVKITLDAFHDALTFRIFADMIDYTADEQGKLLCGDKNQPRRFSEYWNFIRRRGVKKNDKDDSQCPNCGAPLKVNMAGVCDYCHGKITNGDFDWVLSRIEQDESYRG